MRTSGGQEAGRAEAGGGAPRADPDAEDRPRPPTPERRAHARAPSGCAQLKRPTDHDWNDSCPRLRAPAVPRRRRHGRRSGAVGTQRKCTGPQRKRSVAAPSAGGRRAPRRAGREQVEQKRAVDAVVPRARAGAGAPRAPAPTCHMSHVTTKSCSWSRCSSPSVTYALAHVTSTLKLCGHAPPCGGPTQRSIGLRKALKKASLEHVLACVTKSAQSSSPSVARTCLAMRLSSPLQRCCACLRANLDSLTGWAGWYARRR